MHRLSNADPHDVAALRAAGWIRDGELLASELVDALRTGPDPDGALRRVADLARTSPAVVEAALADPVIGRRLVALAGGSRALTGVLGRIPDPLKVLAHPEDVPSFEGTRLAEAARRALTGIAAADLAGDIDMPRAGRLVSDVADAAACAAHAEAGGLEAGLAVIAMGKWGGRELNYASDIDLLFVHVGPEEAATDAAARMIDILGRRDGGAFRVDADLRPEGASGPLTRTLDSYRAYWSRWAETWEAQALLKARPVAGDPAIGEDFLAGAEGFVFPERMGADAVRSIRTMKARAESLLGADVTELKRGIGGIRDVEFAVQLLQLVHGRADRSIRSATTLDALEALAAGGYILGDDAADLAAAYRWLRDAEHRIQLFDLRQTHVLPTDPDQRERIARAMGYRDSPAAGARDLFERDLADHRAGVRSIHERLFHRPVLEALAESRAGAMTPEAAATRLAAFGFLDTDATREAVADLTAGLSRRSSLMRHMLPLIMEWLSLAPDPDLGLAQLRRLVDDSGDSGALVGTLRDDPLAAERLCTMLGTSRLVGRLLDRLPPLVPQFGDDAALARWPDPDDLRQEALTRMQVQRAPETALHGFHSEHLLRIVVADLAGLIDEIEVGRRLSDLADATVHAAVHHATATTPGTAMPGLVALGKWGGQELNYSSDLDGVLVIADDADTGGASSIAERVIGILGSGRAGFRSLHLDLDLRPEGRKGSLVRSLSGYRSYWSQWAETWEAQAMLRARPAAGDADMAATLAAEARQFGLDPRPDVVGDVRHMKARIESERIPLGEDPDFHLKLGRGSMSDVEWTVQLIQMLHGDQRPEILSPSTLESLRAIEECELLPLADARALAEAYRFCARVRNRLYLRSGRTADSLPTDHEEATRLARSLGYTTHPRTSLREDYRRLTRRARRVVDHRFYGLARPGDPPDA